MAEISKFAEEIMVEIMSRLPPKSLMRFKCVRRSWNDLISNPNFAAKHLSTSKRTELSSSSTTLLFRRFLIADENPNEMEVVLSLFNFCSDFHGGFLEDIHFPDSMSLGCRGEFIEGVGSSFKISCHCDGIICVADYGQKPNIVLCNPAIKEFKLLPESRLALSSPDIFPAAAVGFGCDLRLRNYKVVRLIHTGRDDTDQGTIIHPPKAEVFDLLANSWKEIKSDGLVKENIIVFPDLSARTKGIYFKGIIYWCGRVEEKVLKYNDDNELIVDEMNAPIISFNIGDEAFNVTCISSDSDCCLLLAVLGFWKESIALCVRHYGNFDVWVMDEFGGGKDSWTKHLVLEPVVKISSHFAVFRKSDEPFVFVAYGSDNDSSDLIFYDIRTNKYNYVPLNGELPHCTQIVEYVSSIVSLKDGNSLDKKPYIRVGHVNSRPSAELKTGSI